MIGSDNIRRGTDRAWQPRGIGHNPTFRCWRCDKAKSTHGAKLVGPLRLKVCAECANAATSVAPER